MEGRGGKGRSSRRAVDGVKKCVSRFPFHWLFSAAARFLADLKAWRAFTPTVEDSAGNAYDAINFNIKKFFQYFSSGSLWLPIIFSLRASLLGVFIIWLFHKRSASNSPSNIFNYECINKHNSSSSSWNSRWTLLNETFTNEIIRQSIRSFAYLSLSYQQTYLLVCMFSREWQVSQRESLQWKWSHVSQ